MIPGGWTRWHLLGAFWVVQGVAALVGWPVLFGAAGWSGVWDRWTLSAVGLGVLSIMVMQLMLLAPAFGTVAAAPLGPRRALRCVLGGLGFGVMAGWLATVVWWVGIMLDLWDVPWNVMEPVLPDWLQPWPLVLTMGMSPVAMVALWYWSRDGLTAHLSVAVAAFVAALLVTGLVGGVVAAGRIIAGDDDRWREALAAVGAAMLLSWIVATPVIAVYTRRWIGMKPLERIAHVLFAGTVVQSAALIPLDVMIRRRTDCYCFEGTYWSLTACWAAGLIVLGPIVFLLPARQRQRRLMRCACVHCGYDMRATPGLESCPECGKGWRGEAGAGGC